MKALQESIYERLQHPLPGPEIWRRWISRPDRQFDAPPEAKKAAVLICLYKQGDDLFLPVMMRPSRTGPHSGQISLPGGAFESDRDANLIDTALREAEEEMGIRNVNTVGTLSSVYIPVSGFLVQPVIGTVDVVPEFQPDPTEVERIIEVPVNALLDRSNHSTHTFEYKGKTLQAPAFRIDGVNIWGATAMILAEFLHIYEAASPPPSPVHD